MTVPAGRARAVANWKRAAKLAARQARDAAHGVLSGNKGAAHDAGQMVRVCVLIRRAYGMPRDAKVYAKVACSGQVHRTDHVTGVCNPTWQALFAFDVSDVAHTSLVFQCKHHRHLSITNVSLGRVVLPLSRVSSSPETFAEPHRLDLVQEGGLFGSHFGRDAGRQLEVQVFMSTHGELAAKARTGKGHLSVLAATWNVGNALPPPPEQLASLWLLGTSSGSESTPAGSHHLVAVAAQECSYLKEARASRAGSGAKWLSQDGSGPLMTEDLGPAAGADSGEGGGTDGTNASQQGNGNGSGSRALDSRASSRSLGAIMAAAAAGAQSAPDTTMDEDDEVEAGEAEGRQRMSRAKSLKGLISSSIDSGGAWETHVGAALGPRYWLVASRHMFQCRVLLYARMDVVPFITETWTGFEATGIGRVGLNKGGVGITVKVGGTRIAFVGCHLAAHQSQCSRRNHDVGEIIEELTPANLGRANITTGPDHIVWMGDLNYRLDYGTQKETLSETPTPEDHGKIVRLVNEGSYAELFPTDQLQREMKAGRVFVGFTEAPISFAPTFKVLKGEAGLNYSQKRSPAWCDRVLVRSNLPHKQAVLKTYYGCPTVATSDHKPVAATMDVPLVAPPFSVNQRPKPFRLYVNAARVANVDSLTTLGQAIAKRVAISGATTLRLLLSGPALGGGRKEQVINLDMAELQAGYLAASAASGQQIIAANSTSLLHKEESFLLQPSDQAHLRDAKLLVRLALQEGLCHNHTIGAGVLPLQPAVDAYAERDFAPAPFTLTLETVQGVQLGQLTLATQIFSPVRTRGIVAEAVRRMRLLAAAGGFAAGPRAASASAAAPKRLPPAAKVPASFSA